MQGTLAREPSYDCLATSSPSWVLVSNASWPPGSRSATGAESSDLEYWSDTEDLKKLACSETQPVLQMSSQDWFDDS